MSADEDPGKCPHCGGESDGSHMYSAPPQTRCRDCGKRWSFGKGIEVLSEEEGRKRRPELYERPCAECDGTGKVLSRMLGTGHVAHDCPACAGTGRIG
jgi:RecJ-like exonuclease